MKYGAIFDVDGTLLDSMPAWSHVYVDYLTARSLPPDPAMEKKLNLMSMEQIAAYAGKYPFEAVVPVSARDGSGIDELLEELKKLCRPGGHLFPDDTLTDQPERVLAAEMVREKLLRLLDKEIPHGVAVVTERMRERENGVTDVDCVIFTEKDSHKGIIIGKGGRMLKQVGTLARKDMEAFFGGKVNLTLWVRVKEAWRNRREILHTFGFDEKDFEE